MNHDKSLARRVREIRRYLYGENGLDALARALRVPVPTWRNYERGVTMPAEVLLDFIEVTGVDPHWLSTGEGERLQAATRGYDSTSEGRSDSQAGAARYVFPPPVGPELRN